MRLSRLLRRRCGELRRRVFRRCSCSVHHYTWRVFGIIFPVVKRCWRRPEASNSQLETMGAAHSRARPGTGPTKGVKFKSSVERDNQDANDGYFILCLKNGDKTDKIKVVNASGSVHKLLQAIIGRNTVILKSGWDRHLVFSYKLQKSTRGRHSLIQVQNHNYTP